MRKSATIEDPYKVISLVKAALEVIVTGAVYDLNRAEAKCLPKGLSSYKTFRQAGSITLEPKIAPCFSDSCRAGSSILSCEETVYQSKPDVAAFPTLWTTIR